MMPVPLGPGQRFNEGKVDPRGRLLFGSMQDNMGPNGEAISLERWEGQLFCVDDGELAVLDREIGISNTSRSRPAVVLSGISCAARRLHQAVMALMKRSPKSTAN